jgi:hypothetical protein
MNKLFEQNGEWSLDDVPADGTVISTKKVDTKKVDKPDKELPTKPKVDKPDEELPTKPKVDPKKSPELVSMERSLANPERMGEITKLMINGINYMRYLQPKLEGSDIDEYAIMNFMLKHLRGHDGIEGAAFARYCDLIYRFSNPSKYGNLHTLIKKYPKQYNYFISRNGKTSVTFDWLIAKNGRALTFYTPFVGGWNTYADYLDWEDKDSDTEIEKRISKLARSFQEFNPPKKVSIVKRLTDLQINTMVLACYNVKAYGAPQDWLRIKK